MMYSFTSSLRVSVIFTQYPPCGKLKSSCTLPSASLPPPVGRPRNKLNSHSPLISNINDASVFTFNSCTSSFCLPSKILLTSSRVKPIRPRSVASFRRALNNPSYVSSLLFLLIKGNINVSIYSFASSLKRKSIPFVCFNKSRTYETFATGCKYS